MRRRSTGIAAIILLTVFAIGCGETFRPIAIPQPQPGGDPNNLKHAIVLAQNPGIINHPPEPLDPTCAAAPCHGSTSNIDTTGDVNVGNVRTGITPVHTGFVSVSFAYTANQGDNTVTRFLVASPFTPPVTIPMPAGCVPNFVMSRNNGTAYVACKGIDQVAVMNVSLDSIVTTVNVGAHPIALDETLNGQTIYSLNSGGTITVFAAIDNTVLGTINVGGSPTWSAMSPSGTLYVANASGYVSVINTTTNTLTTNIPLPGGASPTFMVFDAGKQRLWVVDNGIDSISVIDGNPNNVPPAVSPATFNTVLKTITVGSDPRSVTALASGNKAYVANCGSNTVSVIDATSLALSNTISTEPAPGGGTQPIGTCPISLASPSDGSRVVVGVKGGGLGDQPADPPQILNINTQNDTVINALPTAPQNSQCAINGTTITYCPLQQPVFVTMAP